MPGNREREVSLALKNDKIFECHSQPQLLEEKIVGSVWSFRDVTERQRVEALIEYRANHDALTDLPNRQFFNRQLATALTRAQQSQRMLAVMFLDLDRFKMINDTLGHAAGDHLLQKIVERLAGITRGRDLIARWGGMSLQFSCPKLVVELMQLRSPGEF